MKISQIMLAGLLSLPTGFLVARPLISGKNQKPVVKPESIQKQFEKRIKNEKSPQVAESLKSVFHDFRKIEKNGSKTSKKQAESILHRVNQLKEKAKKEERHEDIKLLAEIKKLICKCCKHLSHELEEIERFLHSHTPCGKIHKITSVPAVIDEPGKWSVSKDLVYTGADAAITVVANNVTLNFCNHSLTLTNPAAEGVRADGIYELAIENDIIQAQSISNNPSSAAIHLINVQKAKIDNVFTYNTFNGVLVENSDDVQIVNSHMKNHVGTLSTAVFASGVAANNVYALKVDNCVIEGTSNNPLTPGIGINVGGPSRDCSITNCSLPIIDFALRFPQLDGLLVDNCQITLSPSAFFNAIELGNFTTAVNDAILKNITIVNKGTIAGVDGIFLVGASGVRIENAVIDVNATIDFVGGFIAAALHIACGSDTGCSEIPAIVDNVLVNKTIIQGDNLDVGVLIETGTNIVIDNSVIGGANVDNIQLQPGSQSTIKNTQIANGTGNGISLFDGANDNTIESNVITNVGGSGIILQGGAFNNAVVSNVVNNNGGDGIVVLFGATGNRVELNRVFENAANGIANGGGTTNQFFFNTSCENAFVNCLGPTLLFPKQFPGAAPAVAGSNVCCDQLPPP